MDLSGNKVGEVTPVRRSSRSRKSKFSEISKNYENLNPNFTNPVTKFSKSPGNKFSIKTSRNPNPIRERKFVVAKRNSKREKEKERVCKCTSSNKCLCIAYESLKASQEGFFKAEEEKDQTLHQTLEIKNGYEFGEIDDDPVEMELNGESGISSIKRRRERLLEEARENVPEPGCGRVMHLVRAFEKLKLIALPKSEELSKDKNDKKVMKWELPGLMQTTKELDTQVSSSSFCPSEFFVTSESLGLDSRASPSSDKNNGSVLSRVSGSGRRSRRNSSDSIATFGGSRWKKRQLKPKPFKLRTEQRGKSKEEELVKKLKQITIEEEKQRVPVAQGLPWTTEQPECLVKPPIKETTKPIDIVLHSDVRAMERAEFDKQVTEKRNLIEQYKEERERLLKLVEEEEIRRMRRELVPKAQPMPYFDRPFIPKRSLKLPTIPREPKFHLPQHKKMKSCMSWNEMCLHNNEMR